MSTNKPRICEVLGVEDGEWFIFGGTSYKIEGLQLWSKSENYTSTVNSLCLIQIIENKDRIIRKPCFTEDEVAFMRTIYVAAPNASFVREENGQLYLTDTESLDIRSLMPMELLPSLRPGQSITPAEIIKNEKEIVHESIRTHG